MSSELRGTSEALQHSRQQCEELAAQVAAGREESSAAQQRAAELKEQLEQR